MQEQTFRRVDVGVTLKVSQEGNVRPLTITFENGKTYTIDRLKERKQAAATKVGGTGIRYTVVIQNRETHLSLVSFIISCCISIGSLLNKSDSL